MLMEITSDKGKISYDLQYKNVKNINLRIKPDGSVCVSANRHVPQRVINEFIISKQEFILRAIEKIKENAEKPKQAYYTEDEVRALITRLCEKAYPYYRARGIKYPEIKFRRMVSRWGICRPQKGILTFNLNLMFAPCDCVEYVVYHEFTHFLQANHSDKFYEELEKVFPNWKLCRKKLKEINIR